MQILSIDDRSSLSNLGTVFVEFDGEYKNGVMLISGCVGMYSLYSLCNHYRKYSLEDVAAISLSNSNVWLLVTGVVVLEGIRWRLDRELSISDCVDPRSHFSILQRLLTNRPTVRRIRFVRRVIVPEEWNSTALVVIFHVYWNVPFYNKSILCEYQG
jgi:hypothetical protein